MQQELRYPALARDNGVSGVGQVTLTVRPTGGLAARHVTQPLSPAYDAEALRVLWGLAPYFSPGSQSGRLVPVRLKLSVWFGPPPPSRNRPVLGPAPRKRPRRILSDAAWREVLAGPRTYSTVRRAAWVPARTM